MTADLQPYPEYKDSGLPWLGRVPAHWEARRAKYLYREVDERSQTGTEVLCSVSHKTGVTPRKANVTMFMAESTVGYKIVRPNDLAINTLWAWMAALGIARQVGVVSPAYGVYRPLPDSELVPEFADKLLRIEEYKAEYMARSTGINASRLRLYPDQFLRIPLLLPTRDEQVAIAHYLDGMDQKVRRFIRNRRRLIEVLNEQKQAIINRAVTRGLDPDAPLKPSGIDWLGDIPKHWDASRLKRYLLRNDGGVWGSGFSDEGTIVLRSTEQTVEGEWRIADPARRVLTDQERDGSLLADGDLLVTRSSGSPAHIGKTTLVSDDIAKDGCCFSNFMQRLRLDERITPSFAWRVLNSVLARRQLQYLSNSTTGLGNLSSSILGNIWIAVPPPAEQKHLLNLLNCELQPFEHAITTARREIDLIREYRTRLIADVVTGKVDVRGLAPAEPLSADEPIDEGIDDEEMPADDEPELVEGTTDD